MRAQSLYCAREFTAPRLGVHREALSFLDVVVADESSEAG